MSPNKFTPETEAKIEQALNGIFDSIEAKLESVDQTFEDLKKVSARAKRKAELIEKKVESLIEDIIERQNKNTQKYETRS